MISDKQAAEELSRLVREATWLDLTPRETLALERAIFVLMESHNYRTGFPHA